MRIQNFLRAGLLLISCILILAYTVKNDTGSNDPNSKKSTIDKDFITLPADTTVIELKTEGIKLSYSESEIHARAGDILLIRYSNESDMSHNIVFVNKEEDIRPVGMAALQAATTDWIPENEMKRIIAYSSLVYSGETVELCFKVPPPGTYPYICTYSAHWTQMQGKLISTE
ncbi:copper binding plastocyanin/azurin family protein [Flavobacteriaceae bacterium MAR_2009_75]|nr:copper binding plastocyanin/azurin family protein [Flavobacteriaceae bacterium MAR_2009_75]